MEEQFINTVAKEQIKSLRKFSGSIEDDVLKWLGDIEDVFDRAQVQPGNKFIAVQSYLTDAAAKWFRSNRSTISDWDTFKREIIKLYKPSLHQILLKLDQRHQTATEPIMTYYYDKIQLCLQADPSMSSLMIVHYLTKGLNNDLLPHVIRRHPTTPNEFLMIAQDEEQIHRTLNDLSRLSNPLPHSPVTDYYPMDNIPNDGDMVALVRRPPNRNHEMYTARQPYQRPLQPLMDIPSTSMQSSSFSRRYNSRPSSSFSSSIRCYVCNRVGHTARVCSERKNM